MNTLPILSRVDVGVKMVVGVKREVVGWRVPPLPGTCQTKPGQAAVAAAATWVWQVVQPVVCCIAGLIEYVLPSPSLPSPTPISTASLFQPSSSKQINGFRYSALPPTIAIVLGGKTN